MYQLSVWAHRHVWPARFLLVTAHILLLLLAWLLGHQWAAVGVALSPAVFYTGAAMAIVGFLLYPSKRRKREMKHFYAVQKTCDGLLAVAAFVMMMCTAQPQALPPRWHMQAQATQMATLPAPSAVQKKSIFKKGAIQPARGLQKGFAKLKGTWQQWRGAYKAASNGEKVALIILSVLVAIALILLVLALACGIACNGSGALALLVGIGGVGLVIFGLVKIINRIQRGPRPKEAAPAPGSTTSA